MMKKNLISLIAGILFFGAALAQNDASKVDVFYSALDGYDAVTLTIKDVRVVEMAGTVHGCDFFFNDLEFELGSTYVDMTRSCFDRAELKKKDASPDVLLLLSIGSHHYHSDVGCGYEMSQDCIIKFDYSPYSAVIPGGDKIDWKE